MIGVIPPITTDYIDNGIRYNITASTITVHEVHSRLLTAEEEKEWMINDNNESKMTYHYIVDNIQALAVVSESDVTWHSGCKEGNFSSISIAICNSSDDKSMAHAIGLIAWILYKKNWSIDQVVPHKKWTGRNCPKNILPKWDKFLKDIEETMEALAFEDIRR
jgi:N-acetylmuramoyl-L-alanine amidase